ncbi:hypothetical protein [Spirosoma luteum]|uniref:hypothetical protein n=1 Tax=Spirosoma luteum TaxID=431553 RepID=UPI000370524A|nr:hypothetical protein [Spirosoma luteum]
MNTAFHQDPVNSITMRFLFVCLGFLAISSLAFSQDNTDMMAQSTRDRINFTNLTIPNNGNSTLWGIKGESGRLIGNPYLDTTWQAGIVKFYGKLGISANADSLAGVPVRLDLVANDVEIRAGAKDIRSAQANRVRYVLMNNTRGTTSLFINAREYRGEADELTGFVELIAPGKLTLLEHPSIHIKRANFNVAMNTGTKDDELVLQKSWYVARDKKAVKFSPGKKAVLELMADKKEQMEAFLKAEKPDLKSRAGLLSVFSYYNKL